MPHTEPGPAVKRLLRTARQVAELVYLTAVSWAHCYAEDRRDRVQKGQRR